MKRCISAILAFILILLFSISAAAEVIVVDGDWVFTKVKDGTAWKICQYNGSETDLTLINFYGSMEVVSVGSHAFKSNTQLTSVTMNGFLEEIGEYAFLDSAVTGVTLNHGLKTIMKGAFSGTEQLVRINPEDTSIIALEEYTFYNSGIKSVALPDTCQSIGEQAFGQCKDLTAARIPESVTLIDENAFAGCENLVIYAPYGSYAIDYAIAYEIPYAYSDLTEVTYIRGDADGDGAITIMDATKIQRLLAYYEDDTDGMIALRASLDGENLGIMDATRIQRKLALYDDPYGIGESVTVFLRPDGEIVTLNAEQA